MKFLLVFCPPPQRLGGGVYALIIPTHPTHISVGSLGIVEFEEGWAAYIGSAQRSLRGRLKRHFCGAGRLWWHVDYILEVFTPIAAFVLPGAEKECEERLARSLSKTLPYVNGFGSSDDSSPSHLFLSKDRTTLIKEIVLSIMTNCKKR